MKIYFSLFILSCLCLSAQINNGLVAKYSFNAGNSKDDVGRFDAKAVGVSYVADRFGNAGYACYVHGNPGSYLNLGTDPALKPFEASISMWVNIDIAILSGTGLDVNPIIITKNSAESDFNEAYAIEYDYDLKKIVIGTTNSESSQLTLHAADTFGLHEWHHIVLTYDDKFSSMYIDGKLEIKMAKNFRTRFLESDSVIIGSMVDAKNNRYLCAAIDDIKIYDIVITPEEVSALYNEPDPNRNSIYLRWILRFTLFSVLLITCILVIKRHYRRKAEEESRRNALNAHLNELETKAIRTQMNPHFVFNSLNTLQRFILEKDVEKAEIYIGVFAKLLRKLLESSVSDTITLSEEIDILNKYIQIEKLRFEDEFEYSLICKIKDPDNIRIPFMMVQPFVENAIWHGLLPATTSKKLEIIFSEIDPRSILCIVEDNGVGREYSSAQKDPLKNRSMAMDLIKQRLDLIKASTGIDCRYTILDKKEKNGTASGTRIELILPIY